MFRLHLITLRLHRESIKYFPLGFQLSLQVTERIDPHYSRWCSTNLHDLDYQQTEDGSQPNDDGLRPDIAGIAVGDACTCGSRYEQYPYCYDMLHWVYIVLLFRKVDRSYLFRGHVVE